MVLGREQYIAEVAPCTEKSQGGFPTTANFGGFPPLRRLPPCVRPNDKGLIEH